MRKVVSSFVSALALAVIPSGSALCQGQAQPPSYSVITVENMHCAGCAKRIGGKLGELPGVAKMQFDVDKKLFWVHPQPGRQLSPRALWEAVEKANDTPTKLQGPTGTFVKKPQS